MRTTSGDALAQQESSRPTYAWCFDHGRLHTFLAEEGTWCTAAWVALDAPSEQEALKQKELIWGPAEFFDQLPLDRQGGLIGMMDARKAGGA